jgi:hypothetical protein
MRPCSPIFGFVCLFFTVLLASVYGYGLYWKYTRSDKADSCFTPGPCYLALMIPLLVPITAVVLYFNWMGLMFFINN